MVKIDRLQGCKQKSIHVNKLKTLCVQKCIHVNKYVRMLM